MRLWKRPNNDQGAVSTTDIELQEQGVAPADNGTAAEWLATRVSRRNVLVRAGAAIVGFATAGQLVWPGSALASCMTGSNCVTTNCYQRYVCGCTSGVYLRHCPAGTVRKDANNNDEIVPYRSAPVIQIEPQQSGGYYFIFSASLNDRGWVQASCLTTYSC